MSCVFIGRSYTDTSHDFSCIKTLIHGSYVTDLQYYSNKVLHWYYKNMHYTQYTIQFSIQYSTVQSTVHNTVEYTVHYREQYSIQYRVQNTVQESIQNSIQYILEYSTV